MKTALLLVIISLFISTFSGCLFISIRPTARVVVVDDDTYYHPPRPINCDRPRPFRVNGRMVPARPTVIVVQPRPVYQQPTIRPSADRYKRGWQETPVQRPPSAQRQNEDSNKVPVRPKEGRPPAAQPLPET